MPDLLAARSQMAISLGFHIVFAVVGIAMPLMMVIAEWRYLATGETAYRALVRLWARGTAIMFAVGAVSGTVLSFELGLLWPKFMEWAGSIIGMPFSLEGFAFFTEAIFLGIYFYGWDHVSPRAHLMAGVLVALSGAASGVFVVIANAWMNTPAGFQLVNGHPVDIRPIAAMMNPSAFYEVLHMTLAAYAATGFAVAGMHAFMLLRERGNPFHRRAFAIAFAIGAVAAVLQPLTGDMSAREVARDQPVKLAAFEALFHSQRGAPLSIGGIPDASTETVRYGIEIPYALSLMTYHDPHALVRGLDAFSRDLWPPLAVVHIAFQIMVAAGFAMVGVGVWGLWLWWRRRDLTSSRWFLRAVVAASPLGLIATEAGWAVTEVGRQPWIIYGVMRTSQAVTPMPFLIVPFIGFTVLYLFLAAVVAYILRRHVMQSAFTLRAA
jgi:cytochrome bd ubiquinol oxidase subunit I